MVAVNWINKSSGQSGCIDHLEFTALCTRSLDIKTHPGLCTNNEKLLDSNYRYAHAAQALNANLHNIAFHDGAYSGWCAR